MKNISTIPNWEFYYETISGLEIPVSQKICKMPSRTNDWKMLKLFLNENDIKSVGYHLLHPTTGEAINKISESK